MHISYIHALKLLAKHFNILLFVYISAFTKYTLL